MYRSRPFCVATTVLTVVLALAFQVQAAEEETTEKSEPEGLKSTVLATVNGEQITSDDVDILFERFGRSTPRSFILERLIQKAAVRQFLDREKAEVDEKLVDEQIEMIKKSYEGRGVKIDELLKEQNISEEEFRKEIAFQVRLRSYIESEITDDEIMEGLSRVRASHILIATGSKMSDEEAGKKIEGIEKELRAARNLKEAFAEAAGKYSDCPSKAKGGDLGLRTRADWVKPFSDAAFSTEIGQMSPPVKTKFGYHLILVTDRQPMTREIFERKKDAAKRQYVNMKTGEFVADIAEESEIVRFDEEKPVEKEEPEEKEVEENKEPAKGSTAK